MSEGHSRNKGILPFENRLFGVYQPITGWKGNLAKKRVALEQEENIKSIIESMIKDISIREILEQGDPRTLRPDTELVVRPPEWMDTEVVKYLKEQAGARANTTGLENAVTYATHQTAAKTTRSIEFEEKVRRYFERDKLAESPKPWQTAGTDPIVTAANDNSEEGNKDTAEKASGISETRQNIEKISISKFVTELESVIRKLNPEDSLKASVTAGVLDWLKETSPDLLYNLCFQHKTNWEIQTNFVDPIADFDSETRMPILSPIGIAHLFSINPGGSADSDEANINKSDNDISAGLELNYDFLELLKEESKKNIRFAICDNDDEESVIYLDDATADADYEKNVTHAKKIAELHLKKQIRRSMKKVEVKVQHTGTQMCWQTYVDEPGLRLGIPGLERMEVPEGIKTTVNWFPYKEYENAVQEKITLSGQVRRRTSAELREEEKYILYRYILRYLMGAETIQKHVSDEIFRSLFDIEKIFYYIAPDWWLPRIPAGQNSAQLDEAGNGKVSVKEWLVQLDGDNLRNALLNSPWVKVVIPIKEGREASALKWLQLAHVEGNDGLDTVCRTPGAEAQDGPITLGRALDLLVQEIIQQPRTSDSL
ncbi:MAG: hypothetical protein KGZ79_13240 [Dethiobacter sp.]|nr:hypothetical protein [Dethiobacter sp.]